MGNLNKKEIFSVFFGVLTLFLNIIFQFILMYLLIKSYGAQFNGFIKISIILFSFLGCVEGGIGSLTIIYLMKPLLSKDWTKINNILNIVKKQYKINGFIDLFLLFLISFIYSFYIFLFEQNFYIIFKNNKILLYPIWKIFIILFSIGSKNLFSLFLSACYENLIQADQNNYIRRLILIISDLIIYSIIFYFISLNIDPVYIFIIFIFYSLIKSSLIIIYSKIYYPWIFFSKKNDKDLKLIKSSKIVSLKNFGDTLLINCDLIIIAFFFGLKISSTLSLYMTISVGIRSIMMIFINSFKEFFAFRMAKKGRINWKNYIKFETYAYIIGAFLFINQFILSPYFINSLYAQQIIKEFNSSISIWTKEEIKIFEVIFYKPTFSLIISISSIFLIISEPCNILIYAKGNYNFISKFFLILGLINIFSILILGKLFFYFYNNYYFLLYFIIIFNCFILFIRFIFLWFYNWNNLTYNSNFKGVFKNWMILLIPILISILFNYFYINIFWNPKYIFNKELKPIWSWKNLFSFFLIIFFSSILLIFLNSLIWSYNSIFSILLKFKFISFLLNFFKFKNKKNNIFFEDDFLFFQKNQKQKQFINKKNNFATSSDSFSSLDNKIIKKNNKEIYKLKGK